MSDRSSTYVPFFRWFSTEREREFEEVRRLYAWVKTRQDAFAETNVTIGQRVYNRYPYFPEPVDGLLKNVLLFLIDKERTIWELSPPLLDRMSMDAFVAYRNHLLHKQYFFQNQAEVLRVLEQTLVDLLWGLGRDLPVLEAPSPFLLPLMHSIPDCKGTVENIYATFLRDDLVRLGLFKEESNRFLLNVFEASGVVFDPQAPLKKPLVHAASSLLPVPEMVDAYCTGTEFHRIFHAAVPLKLTREERFNHMYVLGGTGAGKTTLIEKLIEFDLASDDPPSMVVIDPHGDMINRLIHADLGIEDRLVYINPRDIDFPPAINIFALNERRMQGYDAARREQVMAGVIKTFAYLFEGLGAETTAKQTIFLNYVIRCVLAMPTAMGRNGTILDMMALMRDETPYQAAIDALHGSAREWFATDFKTSTFARTREELRYRLHAIIQSPLMERLLTAPETKVDFFDELNRGSIILVDTAKDFLADGSAHFGKFVISLVLRAIYERAAIPEGERKDTFVVIDEAAEFFSKDINDILNETRKYRCGLLLAHHYLSEAGSELRSSFMANTGSKFVSQVSASDAQALAKELRCTPDFILDQPRLQFAAHIRSVTPHAVSIPLRPRQRLAQLSPERFEGLIERNRARVSLVRSSQPHPPAAAGEPLPPDISPEW